MHPVSCCCEVCTLAIDELLAEEGEELETTITEGDVVEQIKRTWYWDGLTHVSKW